MLTFLQIDLDECHLSKSLADFVSDPPGAFFTSC